MITVYLKHRVISVANLKGVGSPITNFPSQDQKEFKNILFNKYCWIVSPEWKNLERQDVLNLMVSMTNQAGNLTPSEMERIKWIENEIHLNNLTSANGSQFMIDVNN